MSGATVVVAAASGFVGAVVSLAFLSFARDEPIADLGDRLDLEDARANPFRQTSQA